MTDKVYWLVMKRRLKKFFLTLLLGILVFIGYSHYRLQGTWIRLYQYSIDNEDSKFSNPALLDFHYFHVTQYAIYNGDSLDPCFFVTIHKQLLLDRSTQEICHLPIKKMTSENLIFSDSYTGFLYRKVPDSLKKTWWYKIWKQTFSTSIWK